ncbi:c-type cytochrome [Vibrio superstes]|uniref:Cytochrome c n=1 Tax=Vibrio superstes NBRC 103154 TaxID=1219062 RepID=A0A511QKD3_9VIBR|nr:c-type cytochrome [Vibrio superstes]GEM77780.1 cytochrome c [Vibrio superstes NBRC 103154]
MLQLRILGISTSIAILSFSSYASQNVKVCEACHGADGKGLPNVAPMLAGLNADYLESQLILYSSGARQNALMKPMADQLSDPKVRREAAEYFSTLPTFTFDQLEQRGASAKMDSPYRKLVYQGDWDRDIPACATCHGSSGMGVEKFPRLASQHADYTKTQLLAWKNGTRSGDPLNVMSTIAKKLTDEEITHIAEYFASYRY